MNRIIDKISAVLAVVLLVFVCDTASGAELQSTWLTLETHYTRVFFQTESDVRIFNEKIHFKRAAAGLSTFFSAKKGSGAAGELALKMDGLFGRVQEILDMRKAMEKVSIKVYSDKSKLQAAYNKFHSGQCRIRAWYVFEENSVYVSAADVNAGMLGHELAHAIIDHFLQVKPPKATAEILARYVDRHID
nr:hypothetical protein [Desulfobulbaceae bacterium]